MLELASAGNSAPEYISPLLLWCTSGQYWPSSEGPVRRASSRWVCLLLAFVTLAPAQLRCKILHLSLDSVTRDQGLRCKILHLNGQFRPFGNRDNQTLKRLPRSNQATDTVNRCPSTLGSQMVRFLVPLLTLPSAKQRSVIEGQPTGLHHSTWNFKARATTARVSLFRGR